MDKKIYSQLYTQNFILSGSIDTHASQKNPFQPSVWENQPNDYMTPS